VVAGVAFAVLTPVDVAPADQVYVEAPEAVSPAVAPAQIVGEFTLTTGRGVTVSVEMAVLLHPEALPVTV
jgi:hypothetical protein